MSIDQQLRVVDIQFAIQMHDAFTYFPHLIISLNSMMAAAVAAGSGLSGLAATPLLSTSSSSPSPYSLGSAPGASPNNPFSLFPAVTQFAGIPSSMELPQTWQLPNTLKPCSISPPSLVVRVSNLPCDATEMTVRNLFAGFSTPTGIVMIPSSIAEGFLQAYVFLQRNEDVSSAVQ